MDHLDALKSVLIGNTAINNLVNGRIYKFKPVEKSEADLKTGNQSLISCELQDWDGQAVSSDPVFVVDIRSRKGEDGGAEYCAEIASAVTELLFPGFGSVAVSKIDGRVRYDKSLVGYRCQLLVNGHIGSAVTLSLTPSLSSPQPAGSSIVFVATASLDGLEYRFLLQGPGTGNQWRDLTGWSTRNSITWKPTEDDAGSSTVKVQVRGGRFKAGEEQEATVVFEVTVAGGSNELPSISSLAAVPACEATEEESVLLVGAASDPEGDSLSYRFLVSGPGTGGAWRDLSGWIARNAFTWRTQHADIGSNNIKCQVRDGKHAGPGGFDDEAALAYSVLAAGEGGSNALPTITGLYPNRDSPRGLKTEIKFICLATDADLDPIYYRFWLRGPRTGSHTRAMIVQDWSRKNAWTWKAETVDIGLSFIRVDVRDGKHAGEGGYDATTSISYTISSNAAPTITSLTPNLASPQNDEAEIDFICVAADTDSDKIFYRFWLSGPGTASKKKLVQDWSARNSWHWVPSTADIGDSTIYVEVRDGNHADEGSYDAATNISYTITAAPGGEGTGTAPTITSLTPNLASPRGQGTEITFICVASDVDSDTIYYRFWLSGPGTASKRKIVQDWSRKNAWTWKAEAVDIGESTIYVEIRDGRHAGEGSYDATTSISYTISSNTAPDITSVSVQESGDCFVGQKIHLIANATDADSDSILYRFLIYRETPGIGWEALTGWQDRNWVIIELDRLDYETLSIKCQVRDRRHAGEGSYDDEASTTVDVYRAAVSSLTPSLASPKAHETTIVFTAAANKSSQIYYRFWLYGPGTGNVWRDMTGWQQKNSWSWRTLDCDIGSNQVRCQCIDDPDFWDDGDTTNRQTTISYTIS